MPGFMVSLSLTVRIIAFFVLCLIGLGSIAALAGLFWPYRIRIRFFRVNRTGPYMALFGLVGLAAAALVAGSFVLPPGSAHNARSESSRRSNPAEGISFDVPEPHLPGNPLPVLGCVSQIKGRGELRSGQSLMIASADVNSAIYFFMPVNWQHHVWTATLYLGTRQNAGDKFEVDAIAMPADLVKYVHNSYHVLRSGGAYFASVGLPPSPARVIKTTTVRRSHSNTGCTG